MNNRQRQINKSKAKFFKQKVYFDGIKYYFKLNYGSRIKNYKLIEGLEEYSSNGYTNKIEVKLINREDIDNCKFCHGRGENCMECELSNTIVQELAESEICIDGD